MTEHQMQEFSVFLNELISTTNAHLSEITAELRVMNQFLPMTGTLKEANLRDLVCAMLSNPTYAGTTVVDILTTAEGFNKIISDGPEG